jgi:heme/copper-type cytochrome/quinol oxidase subunit 4
VAGKRDRLIFKFFHLVEGEAEGRFAIVALVFVVLATLVVFFATYV